MNAATNVRKTISSTISAASRPRELGRALLEWRELRLAVVLDRDARGRERVAHGVLNVDHRIAVLVVDHAVELGLGVGDAAGLSERSRR